MTSRTIEVIVSPQGETKIETRGFAGSNCLEVSCFLEQTLGTRASEQLTAEYYQSAVQTQPIAQQGGQR
jgi:hypothetical protein